MLLHNRIKISVVVCFVLIRVWYRTVQISYVSVLLLVMTVAIFSEHWSFGLYEAASFSGSLDYSFALESVCIFLETFGVMFAALEVYLWMEQVDDY